MRIPESYRYQLVLEHRRRRRLAAAVRARDGNATHGRRREPRPYLRLIKHPQGAFSPLYGGW